MTLNERIGLALAAFENDYNCAQAIIQAFPEITKHNGESIIKLSTGFGGGMGRTQMVCGALTGSFMITGLLKGASVPEKENKEYVYKLVRDLTLQFREIHGSVNCRDLLGIDINTDKGKELQKSLMLKEKVCVNCVKTAIELTVAILSRHD
jgi:C_GCAxxG_C_C family probable redox protein